MNHSFFKEGERISLYPLKMEELEKMRALRNRNRHSFVTSKEITRDGQREWYEGYLNRENDYLFSVYYQGNWVGAVSIYDVDPIEGSAEFGRLMIDREAAGTGGLGVEVTKAACQIAFQQLGVQAIELEVYADNIPAQITYLKSGFIPEELCLDGEDRRMLRMKCQAPKAMGENISDEEKEGAI